MTAVVHESALQNIPLELIFFSNTSAQELRREQLDKGKLEELAESIRSVGVAQPILVRPLREDTINKGHAFELVAGERRVRAARMAKLVTIPAAVRELTDEQVVELQLVENLQREDLHELAEAEGYEQLLKIGRSVDEIAAKVGKSRGTVYARMKLLALGPPARKAFYQGKIPASIALLLARIPNEKLQAEALKEVSTDSNFNDGPMSVREAQEHIHQNYMLKLSEAPFKPSDADLVPKAGACGVCPKRTGNQPELFGDVKGADVCTDPACFKQKVLAHSERLISAAKGNGQTIITGPEAKKIAQHGIDSNYLEGYVKLDGRHVDGRGTNRQALGKTYVPALLQDPETGRVVEVAPQKDIAKARNEKPIKEDSWKAQQRATDRKHKLQIAYRVALFKAIRAGTPKRKNLTRRELELTVSRLFERIDHDSKKRLFVACGWQPKKSTSRYGSAPSYDLPLKLGDLSDEQLASLVRDLILAPELQVWQHSGDTRPTELEAAAKREDVNAAAIKREIDQAAAAKMAKAPKKKPKAKKK